MRSLSRRALVTALRQPEGVARSGRGAVSVPALAGFSSSSSLAHPKCAWHGSFLPPRFFSSPAEQKPEDDTAAEASEKEVKEGAEPSSEAPSEEPEGSEMPSWPRVLYRAPDLNKAFAEAEAMINYSTFGSATGLGAALLGVAPYTMPQTFSAALMLAVIQVRVAHIWQMRMLRAQMRRHVEVVEQLDEDSISIVGGHGLKRTLHLSSDASADDKQPPVSEVLRHGAAFVFIDQASATVEDEGALQALLESDRVIRSEDLDIGTFDGESQDEAEKLVQSLVKINSKQLENIAKQSKGMATPKEAVDKAARSASVVGGFILVCGSVICVSGRRQANMLHPGSVPIE